MAGFNKETSMGEVYAYWVMLWNVERKVEKWKSVLALWKAKDEKLRNEEKKKKLQGYERL